MKHILIPVWVLFFSMFSAEASSIVLENDHVKYEVARDGRNLHFTDKSTGFDFLFTDTVSYVASAGKMGKTIRVTSVKQRGDLLFLKFGKSGVGAEIRIYHPDNHMELEVVKVQGDPESLTFFNVPLKLEGLSGEPFGACVLALNLETHVHQLPALQTHLRASCYRRFGMEGARIALVAVPQKEILPVIRTVMEKAPDIPRSNRGGAWASLSKEGYGSYLMNFGTLTEESVPEWIEMCKNLGFTQIDNHGGGADFFRFGDFGLNKAKWPDGWAHFKRINSRLHEAGISSIFHTYAFFIDKNSPLVTPVPSPDLGYFDAFTLAKPLGPDDQEIEVLEPTDRISTVTGFFVRNSVTLRIGTELITFSGVTQSPPYRFTGCKRGVNGTQRSSHETQQKAFHLREMFGRFVPGVDTPLFGEIASKTADIVNECGFDGIYFDAIDGSDILGGADNAWYYGTRFIFEVVKNLKQPVGMEMSTMFHHWWHYRSRWQAWDRPVRGYKRFIDIHTAAIKTSTYDHGLWNGHLPLIRKYAAAESGSLLLPLHLGWWGNQTWNPPQVEPVFPDDIEYLCCKMIGNNAGMSMLGGADKKTLEANPLYARLIPIIRQYEELRHIRYFSDSVRSLLRQPGKEFSLFREENGRWNFKPVEFHKQKLTGINHSPASWTVENTYASQPLRLRIEPLMSVKPFGDPGNIILTDFTEKEAFPKKWVAGGVSGGIKYGDEKTENGEKAAIFSAFSTGETLREGSWIKMEKTFEPWMNIEKNQALGVWIHGDGKGELLNLRLTSPEHISHGARGDHFVKIDFTGWRYFELVEIESSEFSNCQWPEKGFYVYDSYRHTIDFKNVDKLQLWYNNLPAGVNVECKIGPVKALPMVAPALENPEITVNGKKIVFPVTMKPGMFLEFNSPDGCKLYGSKGELLQEVNPEGDIPLLVPGENQITFSGKGDLKINCRAQVTLITAGEPLRME